MSEEKINAAKGALDFVKDGMCIGLGSGSTAHEFIKLLGKRVKEEKLKICAVPTSLDSKITAVNEGISVLEPDVMIEIDLAIDGADVATKTALLKGGGGAHAREKVVDYAAEKFIVIVDEGKVKEKLEGIVALEVLPFAYKFVLDEISKISENARLRTGGKKLGPVISDNGNFLIDFEMEVKDPKKMETELRAIPGVVENGIFTKFDKIVVGTKDGHKIL